MSLTAQESGAAMLRSNGGVLLNGSTAPASSALFPGDTVQTQPKALARIEATGSSVDIDSETVFQFENDGIRLDHGSVSVNTSRGFRVRAGCVTVTPVNEDWTTYEVTDTDGKVTVAALKNDVYMDSRSPNPKDAKQSANSVRVIVREGEQKSREEKCGGADLKPSDAIAAKGAILNSPYVRWPAVGVVVGVTCWALCRGDDPLSPSMPDH